ncbi:P-loop containing nucleoside triphosphate hydrolase protein [Xylaria palmicola]|nr:P-loop containing nucleoside triphosphate hydrolase protein [Xylaria palmicola]
MDENTGTMILSAEEKRYFRALLEWEPRDANEHTKKRVPSERPLAGHFRVLILGPKGCGKTALLTRFCRGSFSGEDQSPDPQVGRGCQRRIEIKDEAYVIDALELAPDQLSEGQYLQHAVAITEAVVLVYDVRSRDSFVLIQELHQQIQETLALGDRRHYALILVGNKADAGEDGMEEAYRMVTEGEGYELACNIGGGRRCAFRETSARTGENVDSLFVLLGTELLKSRQLARECQEQAEAEKIALAEAIAQANSYGVDMSANKAPKWRIWSRFRRVSDDAGRKVAVN